MFATVLFVSVCFYSKQKVLKDWSFTGTFVCLRPIFCLFVFFY